MSARIKAGLGIELESAPPSCYPSSLPTSSVRSSQGMQGLLSAEKGEAMVQLDAFSRGSGFKEGQRIAPESVTPGGGSAMPKDRPRSHPSGPRLQLYESQNALTRQDTILGRSASPTRTSEPLKSLLGNVNSKLKHGAVVPPQIDPAALQGVETDNDSEHLTLEQAKTRARVEVDIVLESNACVQGGYLKGLVKIKICKRSRHESRILIAEGKVRVVGFECIPQVDDRHTFYHTAELFSTISPDWDVYLDSSLDEQGFGYAREGVHAFPFALHLPLDGMCGNPKGTLNINSGVSVRYIAMVSVKVKDSETSRRSIAHFYRDCEIWPHLDSSTVLAPAPRPLQCTTSKSVFMGGPRNVRLTAILHRLHWVAGQRCYIKIIVDNDTKKTIKRLTLLLVRRTTIFRPNPELDTRRRGDPDACQTATNYREVAETTLEMAPRVAKGYASTKGWWTGVDPGERLEFSHFILLPPEALTINRGRLLEVEYCIRVSISAGSLTSDIFVDLPIRIINFLSIDMPAAFSDVHPGNLNAQPASNYPKAHSTNPSALLQSRSKSDIGSLSMDGKLDGGVIKSRSASTDGQMSFSEPHPVNHHRDEGEPMYELGNLDDADNSDEEVDLVVSTARVDQGLIKFASHSDAYTSQIPTMPTVSPPLETVDRPRTRSKTISDIPYLKGGRSTSFATRVEEKIANGERIFLASSEFLDSPNSSPDAETTTPRPHYGWPRSAYTAPGMHASRATSDGSSVVSCSSYSDSESSKDSAFVMNHHQVTRLPSQSFAPESSSYLNSTTRDTRNTNLDDRSKRAIGQAEVIKLSVPRDSVVADARQTFETKVMDQTSEVKKRIEAFEAKTRTHTA